MSKSDNSAKELSKLTEKRLALESLIKITASIQTQQESLLELSVIARPSQEFPAKLVAHIKLLSEKIGDLPVTELIQRLEAIERVMAKGLGAILKLADLDANALRSEQIASISIDDFVGAIDNFKRRTQTAVALRYLLIGRGVAIAPFSLAVPQEAIVGHIESLKVKEKNCVKQIRKEIVEIIKDSDKMMEYDGLSEAMKTEISNVGQAMRINLEHLDNGGSVKEIPNIFETIILESQITESIVIEEPMDESDEETNSENKIREESLTAKKMSKRIQGKPESFWTLFTKWLSSPWSVSWRSLKSGQKKNNR